VVRSSAASDVYKRQDENCCNIRNIYVLTGNSKNAGKLH
jgi:hypothetical protein